MSLTRISNIITVSKYKCDIFDEFPTVFSHMLFSGNYSHLCRNLIVAATLSAFVTVVYVPLTETRHLLTDLLYNTRRQTLNNIEFHVCLHLISIISSL